MRSTWTMLGCVLSACFLVTPVYADAHGRPPAATQHPQAPMTAKSTVKPATVKASKPTTSTTPHGTSPAPTSSATGSTRLNPIAAKISAKPQLDARITALLPKNMTLNQASQGFKNQGQFIAALHVSRNLGCDCFKQLQSDMTKKNMSLGQAIQDVKKTADTTTEVHRAETEADVDVKSSTTTATSSSTVQNKKKATRGGGDR